VILRDLTGRPLQILEQSYRADPISQEMLLSFYEGKTIDFQTQRGDKFLTFPGKIIRSGYGSGVTYINGYPQGPAPQPIIEVNGVLQFGLAGAAAVSRAQRRFDPQADSELAAGDDTGGRTEAEISYVSGGMTWQSDYNLVVSDIAKNSSMNSLDLVGWITMQNHSGKTFENARIRLMAGDVSKLQGTGQSQCLSS
jgi:hypothetical protein